MRVLSWLITSLLWSPLLGYSTDLYYSNVALPFQGTFNTLYNITVNSTYNFHIQFHHNHTENSVVNLMTRYVGKNGNDIDDFPLEIVVRQQLIVQSWNLPLELNHQSRFSEVSKMLCSTGQMINTSLPVALEVSTFSQDHVNLQIRAHLFLNFTVSMGPHYNIHVTPSSPQYYQYTFDESRDIRSVTLHVKSTNNYCATVYIQQARCPVEDIGQISSIEGIVSQTFLESSTVIISKKPQSSSVFIVFTVSPSDQSCSHSDFILPIGAQKLKPIEFWVEPHVKDTVYIFAVLAAVGYSLFFYLLALLSLIAVIIREKRKENQPRELQDPLVQDESSERNVSMVTPSVSMVTPSISSAAVNEVDSEDLRDVDTLTDIEEIKGVFRLKRNLMVTDMSRKPYSKLNKKYVLYLWTAIIISVFYGLPVIQLVLAYQRYLNLSGNEDTCYYNFQCARKLGVLHSFNNVISNLGYVLLGALFLIITRYRHVASRKLSADERDNFGIPRHFGLFYAMGYALMMEGLMSACYHICPSNDNFQFDTSFMYILGCLVVLRLFQSRHPDINANAHSAFLFLAVLIGVAVIGVLFNDQPFWIVFAIFHLVVTFYMGLQIYYVGRFKLDKSLVNSLSLYFRSECCRCVAPTYPARFGLLTFMFALNIALALYGVISQPKDFATFMLAIIIANMFSYSVFYVAMKLFHKERIPPQSVVLGILAAIFWGLALYMFTHNLTDWTSTPAQSRNLNEPCLILDFYDRHDTWHFLSAGALFCSFLAVFYIDDDRQGVHRSMIAVF